MMALSGRAIRTGVALAMLSSAFAAGQVEEPRIGSLAFTIETTKKSSLAVTLAKPGLPLLRPLVNGKDIGWFILDTGAGAMAIAPKAAQAAGLRRAASIEAKGVAGSAQKATLEGEQFDLGPLRLQSTIYIETAELENSMIAEALGPDVVGVIGYDVFERAIVELDARGGVARIVSPENYPTPPGGWQELIFAERQPCVRGRFEGNREGLFAIDTGSNTSVTFYTPAVKKYGLLEGRELSDGRSAGVGGASAEKRGKLKWLEFGGRRFEDIPAAFSAATAGARSEDDADGVLGMELLREFKLVIDYSNRRIAFLPSEKGAGGQPN